MEPLEIPQKAKYLTGKDILQKEDQQSSVEQDENLKGEIKFGNQTVGCIFRNHFHTYYFYIYIYIGNSRTDVSQCVGYSE